MPQAGCGSGHGGGGGKWRWVRNSGDPSLKIEAPQHEPSKIKITMRNSSKAKVMGQVNVTVCRGRRPHKLQAVVGGVLQEAHAGIQGSSGAGSSRETTFFFKNG